MVNLDVIHVHLGDVGEIQGLYVHTGLAHHYQKLDVAMQSGQEYVVYCGVGVVYGDEVEKQGVDVEQQGHLVVIGFLWIERLSRRNVIH